MSILQLRPQDFIVNKVSVKKEGVLVIFQGSRETDQGKMVEDYTMESKEPPHPNMIKCLDAFKQVLAQSTNAMMGVNVLMNHKIIMDQKIPKKTIADYREKIRKEVYEAIDVKSVHFLSNDEFEVIKVTGGFNSALGYAGLNTPNIKLDGSAKEGIDDDAIAEALQKIRKKVYEYVVEGKRLNPGLFDGEQQTEEKAA